MDEFRDAALPWVAMGIAVVLVMTYTGKAKKK